MFAHFLRRMGKQRKEKIRSRLAIVYAIISWNGFAISLYYLYKKQGHGSNLPMGLKRAAETENVTSNIAYRLDGFKVERSFYGEEEIRNARDKLNDIYVSIHNNNSNNNDDDNDSDDF